MADALTKDQAIAKFQALVNRFGLQWDANVPRSAYDEMAACNAVLTEADRRKALGLRA